VGVLGLEERAFLGDAIRVGLNELGWTEGGNVEFTTRSADGVESRLAQIARSLANAGVDVIVAPGPSEALAAARVSTTIPIVFLNVDFPVEQGLVRSYSRPGGNVTGLADAAGPELLLKRLEILREAAPSARRVAWIREASQFPEPTRQRGLDLTAWEASAAKAGHAIRSWSVNSFADVDRALDDLGAWRAQALVMSGIPGGLFTRVVEHAQRQRIPSIGDFPDFALFGGLLSLHVDRDGHAAVVAAYVDRILRGVRPAELPVQIANSHQLYVNVRTARALGLSIPPSLLVRAHRLVE
jgi:putative ABC transport system substrate-binding protein